MKDDSADDLAAFGVPADVLDAMPVKQEYFEIWPENVEVVSLFVRLQTQWRIIGGVLAGLNYQSVQFLFDVFKVEDKATMMDDLQAMESAVLVALNKEKTDGA